MSYTYSLNDELSSFYQVNRPYLLFLYKTEDEFIDEILNQNVQEMTRYDIIHTNIKMSQDKFTEEDEKQVTEMMKKMNKTDNMKEYNRMDKEIRKLNKDILRKRKFIKEFFMALQI